MRRALAATAALSFALLAAGCSGDGKQAASAAPGPAAVSPAAVDPAAAASADAALSADTASICAQAARTSTSFGSTFAADYRLLIDAASGGATAKAQAKEKATRDVDSFSYALRDMAKLTSDPKVKKALDAMGRQVTALKGDVAKIDDKKLADLHAELDAACGRG
ncbi:hypothetical protein ACWT_1254 [Actinoplanes sp. SE50]|uniref:hypothetical protein n=1 Tax=unclassified Actinoplanes TaxID=2626549 RepID=UPI00023ED57C|nr:MULTISPECIES: hypothetical protein [unclassified Actinoplanes]AEV82272.1 hypothetical protein ACPL_1375 [Actinoplanes sp. SE50/110]ATO80669.1 hypothetical protein ACWT_1254 [Actinoplanes sp. SE50]SLL98076.1 hypothetical protein ACSP50_1298 [Actinoplanes sp. SE50/110]